MAQPAVTSEPRVSSRTALRDSLWYILSTSAPIVMLSVFAFVHIHHWRTTGEVTGIGFAVQESVLIFLFLIRRRPKESLNTPGAWIAAVIGSWGVLLVRPGGYALFDFETLFIGLQFAGAALAITATVFLGRSFGIVAANRGVKTGGVYRIVRHPIYASYIVGLTGYLLAAISIWNVLVIAIALAFQIRRIYAEESVLMADPEYREYAERVRYRLVPYIW